MVVSCQSEMVGGMWPSQIRDKLLLSISFCGDGYTGGECCTCGYGGTIELSIAGFAYYRACFGGTNGEANASGQDPTLPTGPTCTTNSDCTSWNNNATSGGFAQ